MSSRRIGKIVGAVLITGGLLVGLPGCALFQEAGPVAILEAIPTAVREGEPVRFLVSLRAAEGRKISIFFLDFGNGEWFESDSIALTSIDRQEIVHFYTLPDGEDQWTFEAILTVYDNAMNRDEDKVGISVKRGAH